jgi:hypothetical protein
MASRFRIIRQVPTEDELIAMVAAVMALHQAQAELRRVVARPAAGPRRRVPMNWW